MPHYWPFVEKWVAAALEGRSITHTPQDMYDGCLGGRMVLWLAVRDEPVACAISCIESYARATICTVHVIGGKGIEDWLYFEAAVCRWAKQRGCIAIEGPGRKGWERKIKHFGYAPVYSVYRKMLED